MAGVPETVHCEPPQLPRDERGPINVTSHLYGTTAPPSHISPLRALQLPSRVRRWLLDAGITVTPLEPSAVRRGMAPDRQRRPFLLFNSGDASPRADAEAAAALGYRTIDIARLLATQYLPEEPDHTLLVTSGTRRRFLERLRQRIEALGGTWLRLADFPHPYRGALCSGMEQGDHLERILANTTQAGLTGALAEIPTGGQMRGQVAIEKLFHLNRAAGRPMWLSGMRAGEPLPRQLRGEVDPLTWVSDVETFARWWHWRQAARLLARRAGRAIELAVEPAEGVEEEPWQGALAVEIWRGRHRALLPIPPEGITIDERTLPFQRDEQRHHAGFMVDEPDIGAASSPIPLMRVAS